METAEDLSLLGWRRHGDSRSAKIADFDRFRPPVDSRVESETYAHLQLDGDEEDGLHTLRPTSFAKQDSWRILETQSPRSPDAKRAQIYGLSISGRESEHGQRDADPTLATLQPATRFESQNERMSTHRPRGLHIPANVSRRGHASSSAISFKSSLPSVNLAANSLQGIVNTYDRILIVLNERLQELEMLAMEKPRKASSEGCRELWTRLVRDTHRLYVLLIASLILFERDADADRQQESGQLNVHEFDTFDYERIKEENDYRITIKMLQRWFAWGGRIHAAFEKLRDHARALRRQGFDFSKLHLSWAGFRQIDEASTRCLERMDTIRELLRRFDLQNATTAVMAAMRFRKLSPKGGAQLAPRR